MKRSAILWSVLLGAAMSVLASDATVDIYTHGDLAGISNALQPKGRVSADKTLARYANHYFLVAKREATGSSEVHEHEADVFVVQSGEASIQTGGKMLNGRVTKPGEIRGTGIEGGEQHRLVAGDIIHIPAGVPHRLLLTKGKPFTYFVVKITGQ